MSKGKFGITTSLFVIYFVCPFIAFLISLNGFLVNRNRLYLLFIFLYIGLFGYVLNVTYDSDMDLMRLYNAYDTIKQLQIKDAWPIILSVGDFSYVFFWLLGQLDIPTQYIGFFSAAWFYGAWFLVILSIEKFFRYRFSSIFLLSTFVIFITVTHPFFFSGVRSSSGTMFVLIGTICLFQRSIRLGFIWLILACFFHFSFIPYLLLCLCFVIGTKRGIDIFSWLLVCGAFLYPILMTFLSDLCFHMGIVGEVISNKILAYSFEMKKDSAVLTYGSGWRFIDNVFLFVACTLIRFLPGVRRIVRHEKYLLSYNQFLTLFFAFCLFISSNSVMLGRYITLLVYLNLFFIVSLWPFYKKEVLARYVFIMTFCSLIFSCIAIYREAIGGDALNYIYYPRLLYQDFFSITSIRINYGN